MKIVMTLTLPADNEIQFADCCNGAAEVLRGLAVEALRVGDHEQFRGTEHVVVAANDDEENVGVVKVR